MLAFFDTCMPRTFYGSFERKVWPRWLVSELDVRLHPERSRIAWFESFWHFCLVRRPKTVFIQRTHALGDILMLLPLLRVISRRLGEVTGQSPAFTIGASERFLQALVGLNRTNMGILFTKSRGIVDYKADVHMDLNMVLEPDHRGGDASDLHRVDLYARALGVELA